MIVNVASNCGESGQYEELVDLQKRYEKDLQVLKFLKYESQPMTNIAMSHKL